MKQIINIQGQWYNLLGMWGGRCYVSKLDDIDNEVYKSGVVWEMQPFILENEIWYSSIIKTYYNVIRLYLKYQRANEKARCINIH